MRHHFAITLVFAAVFLVTACGGGSSPSPSGSPGAGLEGRTFLSTAVDGRVLVAGSRIRLSFKAGQIGASAGCNSMGGAYHLDGGRLITTQLITTEMACSQALMAQDQWVADLFNGSTIVLDGNTLTLAKNGVKLTLLDRVVADPDQPLVGTRWVVDGLISGGTASSIPAGAVAAITITNDQVSVETGCNTGGGTVSMANGSITFKDLSYTKKACPPVIAALETAVVAVLRETATYSIQADTMTLISGQNGLTLRAAP